MSYYKDCPAQGDYTSFALNYMPILDESIFTQKASIISQTIQDLYEQLHQRRKIHKHLLSDLEQEVIETESSIYQGKYSPPTQFPIDLKTLDKRLDLLNKTRRTEMVQYWQDLSKLKRDLLKAKEEYLNMQRKSDLLKCND